MLFWRFGHRFSFSDLSGKRSKSAFDLFEPMRFVSVRTVSYAPLTGDPTCARSPAAYTQIRTQIDHARTVMRGYGAKTRHHVTRHRCETVRDEKDLRSSASPDQNRTREFPHERQRQGRNVFTNQLHSSRARAQPKQRLGLRNAGWRPNLGSEAPKEAPKFGLRSAIIWAPKCPNLGFEVPKFGLRSAQIWAQKRPKKRPRGGGLAGGGGGCV